MKLRHVGIVVGDLNQAIDWYQRFNFFPYSFESVKIAGKMVQLCKLYHKDGSCIELLDGSSAVPHLSITVNRLELEFLKDNFNAKLFEKEGVCYIKDPSGNILEIVEERGY